MLFSFNLNVFAADDMAVAEMGIQAAAAKIVEENPNAEVLVVDNTIHVLVDDLSEIPGFANTGIVPNASYETSVVSAEGGTYMLFDLPWYAYLTFAPIHQVYYSEEATRGLILALIGVDQGESDEAYEEWVEIFNYIVELFALNYTYNQIAAALTIAFNVNIPAIVISLALGMYTALENSDVELNMVVNAHNNSETGKVSVVYGTTAEGYYIYYYSPWNNNICESYGGYDAVWYEGEYDL